MGRKAVVDSIMTGTAPLGKTYIFAKGQDHNSVLAMTGTLAMPAADKEPPYIPVGRKWLGDGVGFSNPMPSSRDPDYTAKLENYHRVENERQALKSSQRPF